jgi:hypothetical protein
LLVFTSNLIRNIGNTNIFLQIIGSRKKQGTEFQVKNYKKSYYGTLIKLKRILLEIRQRKIGISLGYVEKKWRLGKKNMPARYLV